jgi:hypothetical protein
MQESMNAIHWSALQGHLPMIACLVALVPLLMLLNSDFLRLSAKNDRNKQRSTMVLSHMRDKNGLPVFVDAYGQPIEQPASVEALNGSDMLGLTTIRSQKPREGR